MKDEVEESKKIGITSVLNKKRAEGRDKCRPKNFKLKSRRLNPVNTTSYVQILGTGMDTQDTSPSVLLFFDNLRIIFNAGEGLQRFCTEHKIKLSKIDHIFLSRVCSETAGGLPGLLLTLAGTGEEGMGVNVWGPSDFEYLADAMKSFIPKAAMAYTRCFGPSAYTRCFGPSSESDMVLLDIDPEKVDDQTKLTKVVKISAVLLRPKTHALKEDEFTIKANDISVLYICELPEIKGKFDPEKAKALGLRPGPKNRELQDGIYVKSDLQDITIHPDDVLGPSAPGPIVLLVDFPTHSHFQEILSVQSLENYYADKAVEKHKIVNCVIHLSPSSVVNSSDYQMWMSRFGGAEHIMAGHQIISRYHFCNLVQELQLGWNYLCRRFFPAPGFWSLQQASCSNDDTDLKLCKTVCAENLLKFHLRPCAQLGLDRSGIPIKAGPNEIINDLISEIPKISDAAKHISQLWEGDADAGDGVTYIDGDNNLIEEPWVNEKNVSRCLENISRENVEIVFLGTGSSQPSKYRNVSSIFINLFSKGGLLLDCGEGTLGQLKRRFGIQGADNAVKGLKCIWISHIHADHHAGLARILTLRRDLLKGLPHEPLIGIGPRLPKRFLDAYERLEDLDMQFLDCRHTTQASLASFESKYSNISYPIIQKLKNVIGDAGLENVISFPVIHCDEAFGVALKGMGRVDSNGGKIIPGWKIVYSGDTRPCPELVEASRGATVLIHEATFEDVLEKEAVAKKHSTTSEAIEMENAAGAYRIILTHFSQRYPKIPVFDERHMHKTCIAFDMMSINFADLHVLPRVLPYLKLLSKNEMMVDESYDVEDTVTLAA